MLFNRIVLVGIFLLCFCFVVGADAISTMENNLQVNMSDVILIILSCGVIIIAALDARIALMCGLLIYTGLFILYTNLTLEGYTGYNAYFPGVAMMICIVVLCLSLLITYKKSNTPIQVV